jgi:ABC-type transport system involved in cytochrome c biogenesis permease subunit
VAVKWILTADASSLVFKGVVERHSTITLGEAMKFYLAMAAYFVPLLFTATPTMGPQAAIAVTLFWVWIFKSEGRGWVQTAAGIVVLLFVAFDGPMPWQWRDPGLLLWAAFGALAVLPGVWMWRRDASPRFEEPGANEVRG